MFHTLRQKQNFCDQNGVLMKHLVFSLLFLFAGAQSIVAQTDADINTIVENDPEFKGGQAGMMKFIQEHLVYPLSAIEWNVQGQIIYRFVVEKDGSVSSVKAVKSIDLKKYLTGDNITDEYVSKITDAKKEMENAGVKVIEAFPKFIPGKIAGKPVRCYMTLPLNFSLN